LQNFEHAENAKLSIRSPHISRCVNLLVSDMPKSKQKHINRLVKVSCMLQLMMMRIVYFKSNV